MCLSRVWVGCALVLAMAWGAAAEPALNPRHRELSQAWRKLPVPPITPYTGPFGGEARAFVGSIKDIQKTHPDVFKSYWDWKREGTYDPAKDPRPINLEHEKAMLEDWRRMGYNTAYKGNYWTFRSGRWLKAQGLLGAIDQTSWGVRGEPALTCDGKPWKRYPEACGSFFHPANFEAGVTALHNMAVHHGDLDLLNVGGYAVTSSWDEVGMRTRSTIDYRPEAVAEYHRFLKDVWFQDASPDEDTNGDGRTYNAFTGESATSWGQVVPPKLSPRFYRTPQPTDEKWQRPGAFKLWVDFHRYYTFEFFRRVNEAASKQAGRNIECYPFPQAFIVWPGMDAHWGMSVYWNARLNPIITVEQCWPESPAMALNYAQTDRLARKFANVVVGWSWFWFGDEARDMYDGPGDLERALARMMGHTVDGIHHWLYSPQYRGRHRKQRLQLATWHNFLGKHYASFLSRSAPPPAQVALLLPDYSGYFYRMFQYPKADYAYTAQGLLEAQIPFEIVAEEELELDPDALKSYKALYVVGAEWTTPAIRRRIRAFIDRGGVVFANVDSLSLDIPTGRRTDFLAKTFGIRIERKHKNPFCPTAQTPEEETWAAELQSGPVQFQGQDLHTAGKLPKLWKQEEGKAVRDEAEWAKLDALMAKMPAKGRGGIEQAAIDMRTPPRIAYAEGLGPKDGLTTYGEVVTGKVVDGKAIARYGKEVCGVETERTVWLGTRPGLGLHALAPRLSLSRPTEPGNPFVAAAGSEEARRPYVDLIAHAARKAGVRPVVSATRGGRVASNIEVLPRADADGNLMVILVNHAAADAACQVAIDGSHGLPKGAVAWDVLRAKPIEAPCDGRFEVAVPPWRVAVVFVGTEAALKPVREAQAKLDAMDLSVPQYFRDRPALNEKPWGGTPVPPIK